MEHTIGIFDSGVGGLSIWKEIQKMLPTHHTVYLGDGINAPYGEKSKSEIIDLSIRNTEWLIDKGADLIVVACNTATTNAIEILRNQFELPIVGIEPATKPAAISTKTGKIGILATKGTFASELFLNTSKAYRGDVEIIETIGTGLVDIIENRSIEEAKPLLETYLLPMVDQGIDNLVLGCTHYPFLIPIIKTIIPDSINIIEPSEAIAARVKQLSPTTDRTSMKGDAEFYTTGDPDTMLKFLNVLDHPNPALHQVRFDL